MSAANFLDLYAGTGAVGLEALSRGAARASFVEQDAQCLSIIRDNVAALRFTDKATIFRLDATGDLSILPKPFDLIFMGPPYKDREKKMLALSEPTLLNIEKFNLLSANGWVIAQHHKTEKVSAPSPSWEKFREEKYGDSLVSFFRLTQPS